MGSSSPSSNGYFQKYILSWGRIVLSIYLDFASLPTQEEWRQGRESFCKFKLQLPCLNIQHMIYDITQIFGVAVISLCLEYLENSFLGLIGIFCMTLALVTREVVQSFDQSSSSFLKLANFLKVQVSN